MTKIIIVGTLHAGITPNSELEEVIESYKPDQILVEIKNEDIIKDNVDSYPPEMIFAYQWAKKNGIKVAGFDSDIDVFKEGITDADNQRLIEQQKKLIKTSWKEFNKKENEKLLDIEGIDIVDHQKERERELDMLRNINKIIINSGVVLIITGCGHLNFFEDNIDRAIFPFR
ncbi:MAG: hypothetical protein Q7S37_00845 [bacterium]|nr:hypothetical protein [bacterium]